MSERGDGAGPSAVIRTGPAFINCTTDSEHMIANLPLERYLFVLSRLRGLSAAVANIPDFKPDGRTAEYFEALPEQVQQLYSALLAHFHAANLAEGVLHAAYQAAHDSVVMVYACMKSCYRQDTFTLATLRRVPKHDRNPGQTLARMEALVAVWKELPNLPGADQPFTVGTTTAVSFELQKKEFETKLGAASKAARNHSGDLALFHQQLDEWDAGVSAALIQGRALYKPGTAARACIDLIPTAPSTQKPEAAQITAARSEAPGASRLEFGAEHATSFKVFHQGPADAEFTEVAEVLLPGEYAAKDLPAGLHRYYVVPENSRGAGSASPVAEVQVAAAQAA